MSQHLQHSAAWDCASAIADTVDPFLNEEQRRDFFAKAYKACKAMLEAFLIHQNREAARLKPCSN